MQAWIVAGSMKPISGNENPKLDGFNVHVVIGEKKYIISSKDLEQFKIK